MFNPAFDNQFFIKKIYIEENKPNMIKDINVMIGSILIVIIIINNKTNDSKRSLI